MADVFATIAATLAKQGAPVLGSLIGTAIGGPAGAAIGGMAGKAIEALADTLGTDPTPEAVNDALASPDAAGKVQQVEGNIATLLPLWMAQEQRLADAQRAEIENDFGSWNHRRNFAHYTAWGGFAITLPVTLYAFLSGNPMAAAIAGVLGTCAGLVISWTAANSGGKAVTDAVTAWRAK